MLQNKKSSDLNNSLSKEITRLETIVKSAMREQSLSIRKLSKLCGFSPSSVSRILNNKQTANMTHLQQFSKHLNIPLEQLLKTVGIEINENVTDDSRFILEMIRDILQSFDVDLNGVIQDIKKELKKYEQYAKTTAGKDLIHNSFLYKINEINGEGIVVNQLKTLYSMFHSNELDPPIQSIIGSVLLYLILTPDVIPDYAFPLGYLDDVIATTLIVDRLSQEFGIVI